jgi:hypothetical protein
MVELRLSGEPFLNLILGGTDALRLYGAGASYAAAAHYGDHDWAVVVAADFPAPETLVDYGQHLFSLIRQSSNPTSALRFLRPIH